MTIHNRHYTILAKGIWDGERLVIGDLGLDMCTEVRDYGQFHRGRRPETYDGLTWLLHSHLLRYPRL